MNDDDNEKENGIKEDGKNDVSNKNVKINSEEYKYETQNSRGH